MNETGRGHLARPAVVPGYGEMNILTMQFDLSHLQLADDRNI